MSPIDQDGLRMRVIRAIRGGISQAQAARVFGLSRRSVNGWHQRLREGGLAALMSKPRGRPQVLSLKPYQAATVVKMITDRGRVPFAVEN